MTGSEYLQLPQGLAFVTCGATKDEPFEWEYPAELLPGATLAEIDAATGLVPIPPGGTFYESTADFLKSLEDRI